MVSLFINHQESAMGHWVRELLGFVEQLFDEDFFRVWMIDDL